MTTSSAVLKHEEIVYSTVSQNSQPSFPLLPTGRKRRALLWGVASTLLSAVGLVGLGLFEQYNGMISELRADLKHFNETSGDYVKKEKLQKCWELIRETSKEISVSNVAREQLERELKASEQSRLDLAKEMQQLREKLAYIQGLRVNLVEPPIAR